MVLRIFGIMLLFGFTLYLTHNYDPKIIGQYDFTRTYLLVLGSFCLLGTDQSILYFAGLLKSSDDNGNLKSIYKKMVIMIFVSCCFFFALLLLINQHIVNDYFNDDEIYDLLLRATGILFFHSLSSLNTELFRALDSIYIAELFRNTLKYASVIIGSIILLHINQQSYLADTFLVGFILLALISTLLIFRLFKKKNSQEITNDFTYGFILKKSFPIAISTMALFLMMSFDIIFLKKYWGNQNVAFYGVAIKIMTIVSMIINVVNVNQASSVAEYFSLDERTLLTRTVRHAVRLIVAFTLPLVILICLFSTYVLGFFGTDYTIAQNALLILMIGQVFCAFCGLAPVYMNMTGRQGLFQLILISAVIINFVLNRVLIPKYGITGAAIAYSSSMVFWNFATAIYIYRKDRISIFLT
jgi:O-antigen/teichoic acid export membrane protein